jgi:hypothetical protein
MDDADDADTVVGNGDDVLLLLNWFDCDCDCEGDSNVNDVLNPCFGVVEVRIDV